MTDYTTLTNIPDGHNAFTTVTKRKSTLNAFTAHAQGVMTARDYRATDMRKLAVRVNSYSDIGRSNQAATDRTAAIKFSNPGKAKTRISAN